MKVLFLTFVLAFTYVNCQDGREMMDNCKNEVGYTGDMRALFRGEDQSREGKCFFSCLLSARGVLNTDGTINLQKAQENIQNCRRSSDDLKAKRLQALQECIAEVPASADLCEKAYNHEMCMRTKVGPPQKN